MNVTASNSGASGCAALRRSSPQQLRRLLAVAPDDPLGYRTFSGLSSNLFAEIQRQGISIDAVATRDLRWHDALRGAVRWGSVGQRVNRQSSRINPDWYWSRRTHEEMTRRFREKLKALPDVTCVLQIGTHVQAGGVGRRVYCLTDLTVIQAIATGGSYQVARALPQVRAEAIAWQREIFDSCEKIFVLSDWTRRSVIGSYDQAPDKVVTIGAGANVPAVLPPRAPDPLAPTILFVGRDWEQKGGPLLLGAYRRVRLAVPGARLVVIGCDPQGLHGEPGVEVLGSLDRSKLKDEARLLAAYAAAACFCIAPAVDAFPNVLLEASAFGVPVVSTDEGSRSEVVLDGVTGRLVPPDDPVRLGEAIVELLRDPSLAARLGQAAQRRVRECFTWQAVSRKVLRHMSLIEVNSKI